MIVWNPWHDCTFATRFWHPNSIPVLFASHHQFAAFVRFLAKSASEGGGATRRRFPVPQRPQRKERHGDIRLWELGHFFSAKSFRKDVSWPGFLENTTFHTYYCCNMQGKCQRNSIRIASHGRDGQVLEQLARKNRLVYCTTCRNTKGKFSHVGTTFVVYFPISECADH